MTGKKGKAKPNLDVLRKYNNMALGFVITAIGRGHLMKDTRANLYSAKTMLAVIDQHLSECGAKYPDGEADQDG
jgi:hypothetical protein